MKVYFPYGFLGHPVCELSLGSLTKHRNAFEGEGEFRIIILIRKSELSQAATTTRFDSARSLIRWLYFVCLKRGRNCSFQFCTYLVARKRNKTMKAFY